MVVSVDSNAVPSFTDNFVFIGILWVNVGVIVRCRLMDPNLSLKWYFQKPNQRYLCRWNLYQQFWEIARTRINRLLWQYFNGAQTKLVLSLSQTRATHFNQRQREWMAHSNYWAIQSVFSVLVRKWHWDRTVMMACYFEQLMGHDNDIIDLSWHRDNVIPHCFESKWATFFTTLNWCHRDVNMLVSSWSWSCVLYVCSLQLL